MKNGYKKLREGEAGSCEEIERGLDDTAVNSNHSSVQWMLDNLNCSLGKIRYQCRLPIHALLAKLKRNQQLLQ